MAENCFIIVMSSGLEMVVGRTFRLVKVSGMLGGLGVADAAGVDCCAARDAQVRVRRAQSKR